VRPPDLRKAATCADCRNASSKPFRMSLTVMCLKYNRVVEMDQICASFEEPPTGEVNECA